MRLSPIFAGVLVSGLLLLACGDDETPTPVPPSASPTATATSLPTGSATASPTASPTGSPTATATAPAPVTRWLDLLALVPDTAANRGFLLANDYAAAREAYGVDLPPDDADLDVVREYVLGLIGPGRNGGLSPSDLSGMGTRIDPGAWLLELGFSPVQVDADVLAGSPPEQVIALLGRFDPAAVEAAVTSDPEWSDLLEREEYQGVPYYSWGEDLKIDVKRVTATRRLGESIRVAVDDGSYRWAKTTAGIEALIDAGAGRAGSLADDVTMASIAAALHQDGLYTVFMSTDVDAFGSGTPAACDATCLVPYDAFATAAGHDADGDFVVVVLANRSEADAIENATRLDARIDGGSSVVTKAPWAEYFTARDVAADGTLVVAKLRTEKPRIAFDMVYTRDTLLMHEASNNVVP